MDKIPPSASVTPFPAAAFDARPDMRAILNVWPTPLAAVAKELGVAGQALRFFVRGEDSLTDAQLIRLRIFLHVERGPDAIPFCEGPYFLLPKILKAAVDAYHVISGGGDVEFSIEALRCGSRGPCTPDERWHVFLVKPYGSPVSFLFLPKKEGWREIRCSPQLLDRFINIQTVNVASSAYDHWMGRLPEAVHSPRELEKVLLDLNEEHELLFEQLAAAYFTANELARERELEGERPY